MTLSEAITQRQGRRSTSEGRAHQRRAERRMDEIVSVAGIADDYALADRAGDLQVVAHFKALYALVDTEPEREAVSRAFAVWLKTEESEDRTVLGSVDESVSLLKDGNNFWLADGCGPDGRAA